MTLKCQRLATLSPIVPAHTCVMTIASPPRDPAPLRVLVLDDDMISRLVLAELIRSLGHHADEADNALQAIDRCLAGHVDALLVDLSMPDMDGFELLRCLRADERSRGLPATPVVAVTGHVGAEHRARTQAAGFVGHLDKPVERAALGACLDALAARHDDTAVAPSVAAALEPAPHFAADAAWTDDQAAAALRDLVAGQVPDAGFLLSLARTFDVRTRELLTQLEHTDATTAAQLMERLRGCAQGVGANALAARCQLDNLPALADISADFERIAQSLIRAASRLGARPPDPPA